MMQFGRLFDFCNNPTGAFGPPPMLGQHSRQSLGSFAWAVAEIDGLIERGVRYQANEGVPYTWPL